MSMERKKHLEALGLSEGASVADIKAAYKALALRLHPAADLDQAAIAHAKDEFQRVSAAYHAIVRSLKPSRPEDNAAGNLAENDYDDIYYDEVVFEMLSALMGVTSMDGRCQCFHTCAEHKGSFQRIKSKCKDSNQSFQMNMYDEAWEDEGAEGAPVHSCSHGHGHGHEQNRPRLEVVGASTNTLSIRWLPMPSRHEHSVEYRVEMKVPEDVGFRHVHTGRDCSYVAPNLMSGSTHYFRVRACDCFGGSQWSNVVVGTTSGAKVPSAAHPPVLSNTALGKQEKDAAKQRARRKKKEKARAKKEARRAEQEASQRRDKKQAEERRTRSLERSQREAQEANLQRQQRLQERIEYEKLLQNRAAELREQRVAEEAQMLLMFKKQKEEADRKAAVSNSSELQPPPPRSPSPKPAEASSAKRPAVLEKPPTPTPRSSAAAAASPASRRSASSSSSSRYSGVRASRSGRALPVSAKWASPQFLSQSPPSCGASSSSPSPSPSPAAVCPQVVGGGDTAHESEPAPPPPPPPAAAAAAAAPAVSVAGPGLSASPEPSRAASASSSLESCAQRRLQPGPALSAGGSPTPSLPSPLQSRWVPMDAHRRPGAPPPPPPPPSPPVFGHPIVPDTSWVPKSLTLFVNTAFTGSPSTGPANLQQAPPPHPHHAQQPHFTGFEAPLLMPSYALPSPPPPQSVVEVEQVPSWVGNLLDDAPPQRPSYAPRSAAF